MENQEIIIEDLKRLLMKIDSSINLMVNGRFIPAHEKMKGIRHIICNMISSLHAEQQEEGEECKINHQKELAETQLNSEKDQ